VAKGRIAWKKAVAPVLATLLMIAVAVSMSVVMFMWGQGFLSQTSEATGAQQGAQNQAAQSSIAIEAVTFGVGSNSWVNIIVRNVGAVAIELGTVTVTGISANTGFTGSIIGTLSGSFTPTASDGSSWSGTASAISLPKGASAVIVLSTANAGSDTTLTSGDLLTIKVTTSVGTFAQTSLTVP
jgi:flagellin-like protein